MLRGCVLGGVNGKSFLFPLTSEIIILRIEALVCDGIFPQKLVNWSKKRRMIKNRSF